ncbi:MAG: cyclic nucleotide-binding domain-containing protein, partial [Holophagales bacterium]|nr:cyclic nucleotide-binding domain-containing protein [Holophagales bacterium]
LGFGLAGGSFAVGIAYVSAWTSAGKQGTALGIFGAGNAGAALTTLLAPRLLSWLTEGGAHPEAWRLLPKAYAGLILVTAVAFWLLTQERSVDPSKSSSLSERLAPLREVVVWRFGLYYFLVFGGFVALAQWIVPYSVSVYELSVAQAGVIAAAFSLPSGVIRALGGWLSDRFGGKTVMYWVFGSCVLICLALSIPRMDITSPGTGVAAKQAGTVQVVTNTRIEVGETSYSLVSKPDQPVERASHLLPRMTSWQEPTVVEGDEVVKKGLLARGVTRIVYPADVTMFAILVFAFGVVTGIGKAGVYKFIPDQFPDNVGAVGGMVGLLGALGGFVLPPVFGYLLRSTGLWSTCWVVLTILSLVCLVWMHRVAQGILRTEAPDLVQLLEHRPATGLRHSLVTDGNRTLTTVEDLLEEIPFFSNLSPERLRDLAAIGKELEIDAETVLFTEGDPGESLYVILEGAVRIFAADGEDLTSFSAGDYFGELALLDGQSRSASAQTTEASRFFIVDRREFLTLLSDSPRMLGDLLVSMSYKIRRHIAAKATLQGAGYS